jgi:hypothetical protein
MTIGERVSTEQRRYVIRQSFLFVKQTKEQCHMRIFKLTGALMVVLAFSAIGVATASAVETLWRWLPGSAKETFKGGSKTATLQVEEGEKAEKPGPSIACTKSELLLAESELLEKEAKLALAQIHFTGCKTLGLAMNSAGDAKEVVLTHVEIHNCLIKANDFGLLIKLLPVTLEVPATKLTIAVEGIVIGLIAKTGANKYGLTVAQKAGLQEIQKCEGGVKETLLAKIDAQPKFGEAGEEAKEGIIEFDKTIDKVEEEIMI